MLKSTIGPPRLLMPLPKTVPPALAPLMCRPEISSTLAMEKTVPLAVIAAFETSGSPSLAVVAGRLMKPAVVSIVCETDVLQTC